MPIAVVTRAPPPRRSRAVLGALHAVLDPVGALGALRRAHTFGGVIDDVGDGGRARRLVVFIDALGDFMFALVALAERHADLGAERLVLHAGEGLHHIVDTGL